MANAVLSTVFGIVGLILIDVWRADLGRHLRYPVGAVASFILAAWGVANCLG